MKPNEISRARTNARQPRGMASRPPQICCTALSSAANTVLAPTISITTLTIVAHTPSSERALSMASRISAALCGPNSSVTCEPRYEYASSSPTIQPAMVTMMMSSGASENAQ